MQDDTSRDGDRKADSDILASIRRIVDEEAAEARAAPDVPRRGDAAPAPAAAGEGGVLVLSRTMRTRPGEARPRADADDEAPLALTREMRVKAGAQEDSPAPEQAPLVLTRRLGRREAAPEAKAEGASEHPEVSPKAATAPAARETRPEAAAPPARAETAVEAEEPAGAPAPETAEKPLEKPTEPPAPAAPEKPAGTPAAAEKRVEAPAPASKPTETRSPAAAGKSAEPPAPPAPRKPAETPARAAPAKPAEAAAADEAGASRSEDEAERERAALRLVPPGASGLSMREIEDIARRVLREELSGPLGDRVSQNIKRLIEREVARALRDFSGR